MSALIDESRSGILMYEMLTGLPPFYAKTVPEMKRKILEERLRFPGYVSPEARNIISGLLDRNVSGLQIERVLGTFRLALAMVFIILISPLIRFFLSATYSSG